jgi:hypothetical protein
MVMVWSSCRYLSATKLNPVVTTMRAERNTCSRGLAERSDGLKANGHSATALNTT